MCLAPQFQTRITIRYHTYSRVSGTLWGTLGGNKVSGACIRKIQFITLFGINNYYARSTVTLVTICIYKSTGENFIPVNLRILNFACFTTFRWLVAYQILISGKFFLRKRNKPVWICITSAFTAVRHTRLTVGIVVAFTQFMIPYINNFT